MSRKNMIGISEASSGEGATPVVRNDRPIAGFVPAVRNTPPVGGITRTLGNITGKIERAESLERQLAEGQMIVELDPEVIDSSFINDRLAIDSEDLAHLADQVRQHGQQVPILVRPNPADKARYQVAYGHRRLAVARQLGRKVRAVVRDLTDEQLVVSQGQENNTRKDLSFIERALFASRLEDRNFSRDTIMAALGVDKTALSRMIAVVRQVPLELIVSIGAAPTFGRRRWLELMELLSVKGKSEEALSILAQDELKRLTSDQRFQALIDCVTDAKETSKGAPWQTFDSAPPVKFKRTETNATFVFNNKVAPGFDEFVKAKLGHLYAEYQTKTGA